jgi:hypothetical protein
MVPAAQFEHIALPVEVVYWPAAQPKQPVLPVDAAY